MIIAEATSERDRSRASRLPLGWALCPKKAEILQGVLGDVRDPARWPVQAVQPSNGDLVWWVDDAAAAGLDRGEPRTPQ